MDPAWLTIILTVVWFGLFKLAGWYDNTRTPLPEASEKKELNPYICEVYETRVFEQKLIDQNIIDPEEMTQCENTKCANCYPVPAQPTMRQSLDRVYELERKHIEYKRKVDEVNKYKNYRPEYENHMVVFEGTNYLHPNGVPDHARIKATRFDGALGVYQVLWAWLVVRNGFAQEHHYKVNVTPQTLAQWQHMPDVKELANEPEEIPIHDPDTKKYLGSVYRLPNGRVTLSHKKPVKNMAPKITTSIGPK